MYNPLIVFNDSVIQDAMEKNKRWFVRQTYARGYEPGLKSSFILRGYTEEEKDTADLHMLSIEKDVHRYLYDIDREEDVERLKAAARQPAGYKVYYAGKSKIEFKPPNDIVSAVQKYIRTKHPGWRTKKGETTIEVGLYEKYGELYLNFSLEGYEDDLQLLAEVEKYR